MKFWLRALYVFFAMAVTDAGWTLYMSSVAAHETLRATLTSALIMLAGGLAIVSYTKDPRLLVAATLGAAAGTAFTMQVLL